MNEVYNAIAPHFSATRFAVWPKVREFVARLAPGALVADVGCGNGKYFGLRRDVFTLGTDRSTGGGRVWVGGWGIHVAVFCEKFSKCRRFGVGVSGTAGAGCLRALFQ